MELPEVHFTLHVRQQTPLKDLNQTKPRDSKYSEPLARNLGTPAPCTNFKILKLKVISISF